MHLAQVCSIVCITQFGQAELALSSVVCNRPRADSIEQRGNNNIKRNTLSSCVLVLVLVMDYIELMSWGLSHADNPQSVLFWFFVGIRNCINMGIHVVAILVQPMVGSQF